MKTEAKTGPLTVIYDDKISRYFLLVTLIWGIVGMLVGVIAALQIAWWPANTGLSWFTFGRIRPLHTNAVVFAFSANAFFCALYYSMQRLLKTRMWSDALSWIHFWGWQLIIVLAAVSFLFGITQGKEYAELEWPVDILIAVIWIIMTVNVFATIAIRQTKHLYVAIWFYIGSILTIAMLHVVNALAIPVDLFKSYPIYSGVQDALVQWWYGHNAVGFLLTTPFLGLMYYFVPKVVGRPVYSYRLSIIHFWSLVFIYIWAGPHHLLYTALPEWAQSLGMVFSIMLIAPSWGGMLNGLLTIRGSWSKVKSDPILKFFVMALTFYGMATLEGPLLSIKKLNLLSHYTDWTIAHVHGGALGWVGGMIFGMTYYLVPKLWKRELYSKELANWHFWIATLGLLLYIVSMWTAGLMQGLMWFATESDGSLSYPNFLETVIALNGLYWARFIGGTLYLVGALVCMYNVCKTIQGAQVPQDEKLQVIPEKHVKAVTFHEKIEEQSLTMAVLVTICMVIGGIVEFVPTFMIESNIPTIATVTPYTPLELEGRDIYVREGCYTCHSQMVRTDAIEVQRYGQKSEAGEFIYDRPFQWGSKRTGPDLHRLGGKYPDAWHYKHMIDPRSTSPGSIMPTYAWLATDEANTARLSSKLKALKVLGTPYTEEEVRNAELNYLQQAAKISEGLKAAGIEVNPDREIVAMIGYLQRLGVDIKKTATPAAP